MARVAWIRLVVALAVALASAAVIVGFTLIEVSEEPGLWVAVALGTIPVLAFAVVTIFVRWVGLAVLTLILGAYTALWTAGTLSYATSSTGALVFFFVPLCGILAFGVMFMIVLTGRAVSGRGARAPLNEDDEDVLPSDRDTQ